MKTNFVTLKLVFFFLSCLWMIDSSGKDSNGSYLNPCIQMGKVKITGKITGSDKNKFGKPLWLAFTIVHPITGEVVKKEIKTDNSGNYTIELDAETNPATLGLFTEVNPYKSILLELSTKKESKVDIFYTNSGDIKILSSPDSKLTNNDMLLYLDLFRKMLAYSSSKERPKLYDKVRDIFLKHAEESINNKLELLKRDSLVSENFKKYLSNEIRLTYYSAHFFDYPREMELNYRDLTRKEMPDTLKRAEPSREYYRFMQNLNLKSNQLFCNFMFPNFQEQVLLNKTLNIPPIKEMPVDEWQKIVKGIIADLIGFKEGAYYDVLTANAYAQQLNMNTKPLSVKQTVNIHNYFKNGEIEKILLHKNEETKGFYLSTEPLVVQEIPDVDDAHLMETIIEKNKGKVVIVDFWATWCGPCLHAMRVMKEIGASVNKNELTHVYFTNSSSPKELWENRIKGIGGQHYYVNGKTWESLMDKYSFLGIPSYLIFNKEGILIKQFTGYPGNDNMIELIKEASK